ncbi:MAG: efflux RND transporter periplasmic adaptor subunit [Lentisphaeria bacterium]|nr:efflux RND transporter periplasmic adaptor subunit [Lentisphaeria bacterium]
MKRILVAVLFLLNLNMLVAGESGTLHVNCGKGRLDISIFPIQSSVDGKVKELCVGEGQLIKREDKLAIIDADALNIQLEKVKSEIGIMEAALEKANADLKMKEAVLDFARKNFDRVKHLKKMQAVPSSEYDRAENEVLKATADVQAVESVIAAEKSRIAAAKVHFEAIKMQIAGTSIVSNCDGRIFRQLIGSGAVLKSGDGIFKVLDFSEVYVNFIVSEDFAGDIPFGAKVIFKPDIVPDLVLHGKITSIEAIPQESVKTEMRSVCRAKLEMENNPKLIKVLRSGLSGIVIVQL